MNHDKKTPFGTRIHYVHWREIPSIAAFLWGWFKFIISSAFFLGTITLIIISSMNFNLKPDNLWFLGIIVGIILLTPQLIQLIREIRAYKARKFINRMIESANMQNPGNIIKIQNKIKK